MSDTAALILLSRLEIQNANAVSGPLSWGFPAPTAFSGFTHALQRQLDGVELGGVGIVCHWFDPQVYRPPGRYTQVFRLARHPYIAGWKKFADKPASFVEEGRSHMTVSLLLEVRTELDEDDREELANELRSRIPAMRLAGGSVRGLKRQPEVLEWPEFVQDQRRQFRKLRYRLLPGFTLVERQDVLAEHLDALRARESSAGPLDALLDLLALHADPELDESTGAVNWRVRSRPGWLVPVPAGYAALSELHEAGSVAGARDMDVPFQFVESLYTVGQWVAPHRLSAVEEMFWYPESDAKTGIYRSTNRFAALQKELSHGKN